jgi:putative Mg2+ transporter-C (MgtC) family protein
VRGLTTAASIWVTAAIGILTGIGFYFAAGLCTLLTLGTLSLFRWIEGKLPTEHYANFMLRFAREAAMPEPELRRLVAEHGFTIYNLSYRLTADGEQFEYRMVLRALGRESLRALSDVLKANRTVLEYRIAPASD